MRRLAFSLASVFQGAIPYRCGIDHVPWNIDVF
jgi:hypothetical protein